MQGKQPGIVGAVPIGIAKASRADLSAGIRSFLGAYYKGRPGELEWVAASVVAWRPGSLAGLHARIAKADPRFMPFEAFREGWGSFFSFDADAAPESAPDWSRFWEMEPATCYGREYPACIRAFLGKYFAEVQCRDPRAKVLDIGTGNHAATVIARSASPGFQLYGIDIAKVRAPPVGLHINVLQMSAEHLAFPDAEFAAVVSVNGIEYADVDRAFAEMFRVMRPGATAALVLHRSDSLVLARALDVLRLLEDAPVLETLALAWLYVDGGTEFMRREVELQVAKLEKSTTVGPSASFYVALWDGVRSALRDGKSQRTAALRLIEQGENYLRWTRNKNRFLASHVAAVAIGRDQIIERLVRFGFMVDNVEDLRAEDPSETRPVGWAVRLNKPSG